MFVLLYLALGSFAETLVILATLPDAFVGGIVALLARRRDLERVVAGRPDRPVRHRGAERARAGRADPRRSSPRAGRSDEALREASIGRVRPKVMTALTAILGLLPLLVLHLHGTEIERPLAIVMIGGLVTSTLFTLLALPTFYLFVHDLGERFRQQRPDHAAV